MSDELQKFQQVVNKFPPQKLQRTMHSLPLFILRSSSLAQGLDQNTAVSRQVYEILSKRLRSQENKSGMLGNLLRQVLAKKLNDELNAIIIRFMEQHNLKAIEPINDLRAFKASFEKTESNELPPWKEFDFHILDALETRAAKTRELFDILEKILYLYNYGYDSKLDSRHFVPGTKQFNPTVHTALRKTRSSYSHNTIIEVLKIGIISKKDERLLRKALVVVSFNK